MEFSPSSPDTVRALVDELRVLRDINASLRERLRAEALELRAIADQAQRRLNGFPKPAGVVASTSGVIRSHNRQSIDIAPGDWREEKLGTTQRIR